MAWPYYPNEEFAFKGEVIVISLLDQILLKV